MGQRRSWYVHLILVLVLVVLIAACSAPGSNSMTTPAASRTSVVLGTPAGPMTIGMLSPAIDTIAQQVLQNMHAHSWNPDAMTRGVTTGGLFINWKMDNPSITNAVKAGSDGNPQHNHDPQVDLFYLTALVEYRIAHPQDHEFDSDVERITTLVLADFQTYSLPKGWIYLYLLRAGLTLQNTALLNEAHTVVSNIYTHWYDPALGLVYNRNHARGDYGTDSTIDSGTALIDAGLRWHQPDWINAGEKTLDHTISVALDPKYHLFYNNMFVASNGQDTVQNYQAKPSTQGESVDELMTAYSLTHIQRYLDTARLVLQSLLGSSGLWDTARGGFFFALDLQKGHLLTGYKETRSQTLALIGLNHFNQVVARSSLVQPAVQQQFSQQEQKLITVITDHFYQPVYHGFFYRVAPDFQVFVSAAGQGIGTEDYFTTEAMGSALDGLQQTELLLT